MMIKLKRQQSQASVWIVATASVIRNSSSSSSSIISISSSFCHRHLVSSCSSSSLAGRWHGSTSSISNSSVSVSTPSLLSLFIISANFGRMTPIAETTTTPRTRKMSTASTSTTNNNNNNCSNNNKTINKHPQVKNRVALLQLPVTYNKDHNLQTAIQYIRKAQSAGAQLCVLPEIWNSPYATSAFPEYAELLPQVGDSLPQSSKNGDEDNDDKIKFAWGKSSVMLMEMAKATNMYIVGGSIPEVMVHYTTNKSNKSIDETITDDKRDYYNTCLVINPHGQVVAKHRKVHLFDVNVPGGIQFKESETLTAGDLGATYFDVVVEEEDKIGDEDERTSGSSSSSSCELGRIGIGICYDIRFPEYALLLTQIHQCKILIYPGAFNLTTGPAHWELLQRARAVDGQCYVLTASPARMPTPSPSTMPDDNDDDDDDDVDPIIKKYPHYSAWGHSSVISPWGEVIATCDETPAVVIADLDMDKVEEMRMAIPTMMQKRHDLYRLVKGSSAPIP